MPFALIIFEFLYFVFFQWLQIIFLYCLDLKHWKCRRILTGLSRLLISKLFKRHLKDEMICNFSHYGFYFIIVQNKLITATGGNLQITLKYSMGFFKEANTGSIHTNCKNMWWQCSQRSTLVLFNSIWSIKLRYIKVWIDCNKNVGDISLWRKQRTANY